MLEKSVTISEAATLIGISKTTVERLWHAGVLDGRRLEPGLKDIRLSLPSVLAYAKRHARMERSRLALKEGRLADVEFEASDLLTSGEVAALLGVSRQTVTDWVRLGLVDRPGFTDGGNARFEFSTIPKLIKQKGKPRK